MPSKPGASGGKRPGAGRKAGAAWKSARPPAIRAVARANVLEILEKDRDPLVSLLKLADDPMTPVDQRIKAYIGAMPFVRPRLSMSVSADVSPEKGVEKVDQQLLLGKMMDALERLSRSTAPVPVTIEAKADETEG